MTSRSRWVVSHGDRCCLQDMGIKPEQDVIVYCFKGSRASNTLMQLRHAGFKGTTTDHTHTREAQQTDTFFVSPAPQTTLGHKRSHKLLWVVERVVEGRQPAH